ncbi:hypothetical protein DFH09DRAFT_1334789 [Mycena vulgaris]|nr:hypothetical protein DFH09DRAFT_1334789 [Mycena vulgaris]
MDTHASPSPPSSSFRPRSLTKDNLKPNAHPYPIKTTSTAALARSNSGSSSPAAARHHYIPTPSPAGPRALPVPPGVSKHSRGLGAAPARPQPKRWMPAQLAAHPGSVVSSERGGGVGG